MKAPIWSTWYAHHVDKSKVAHGGSTMQNKKKTLRINYPNNV